MSPFRFSCAGCGHVLRKEKDLHLVVYQTNRRNSRKRNQVSSVEAYIKNKLGGKCPKCGRTLCLKPVSVEVERWNGRGVES